MRGTRVCCRAGEGVACHNPHRLRHHMPLQVGVHAGKPAGVPAAVCKRFPHLAGCTPLVIPDNILRQVDLVCLTLYPRPIPHAVVPSPGQDAIAAMML